MRSDLLQLAASLARAGEPFVIAIVVRREPASSAQVGNMAVITETGELHGWLGGSCIQPTVVREATLAMQDAAARLISLSPDPDADRRVGVTTHRMTCHSGGSVDIYIEPVMPAPRLVVFGVSPTAQALARLAKVMGYTVDVVDPEADRGAFPDADRVIADVEPAQFPNRPASTQGRLFAVVTTLGQRDEEAIQAALTLEPAYLGVVASRKRFAQVRDTLLARGVGRQALDRIRNPAGIDISAKSPEEVALSIVAEIVQARRAGQVRAASVAEAVPEAAAALEERDPVCGMAVAVATAKHKADHGGRTYYFCCGGCRERFLATPDRYAAVRLQA